MKTNISPMEFRKKSCLTDADLYAYVSGQGESDKIHSIEAHLEKCPACRESLAELLEILQPSAAEGDIEVGKPTGAEVAQTIATIQGISHKERAERTRLYRRFQWPVAAAAAIAFIVLGAWGVKYYEDARKSRAFFSEARAVLEQTYPGASPSNLRLELPFSVLSKTRSAPEADSLRKAENLFFQALAFRENMVDARLGLACIYLNESKFSQAQSEFQKVLDSQQENVQALIGRGVARYEEAVQGLNPVQRNPLLQGALDDFNAALKLEPKSLEARYDKIWALFESGIHKEALEEIDFYLALDTGSVWAEGLRGLKAKMRANQIGFLRDVIRNSARNRDEMALKEFARQVPHRLPEAIFYATKQAVKLEGSPVAQNAPTSADMLWVARILEGLYSDATGDTGLKAFLAFHVGLSPPQRSLKQASDKAFLKLEDLYTKGDFAAVLSRSKLLEPQYRDLKDHWQLANLHLFRGNSYYLGRADFQAAEAEFHKMLEIAERIPSLDYSARALGSLALIHGMQRQFDDGLFYADRLKALVENHNLTSWKAYAYSDTGSLLRRAGQLEQSIQEYSVALEMAYRQPDGAKIVETLENLSQAMDGLGRIQEARDFLRMALKQQDALLESGVLPAGSPTTLRRLNLLFRQGELALRTNDFVSAEQFFAESLKSTPPSMHELRGRNCIGLADIYVRTNRIHEAKAFLESAAAIGALGQYPEIEWKTKLIEGRLLERTGRRRQAILSFRQAIELLERMRAHIRSDNLRQSFFTDRFDPFKTMVSSLYASDVGKKEALAFVDRAKSNTLKEHLKLADPTTQSPEKSRSVANAYPILEYFFADDELLIFLTKGDRLESFAQRIPASEISRQVQQYLESVRSNDSRAFLKIARLLYDELVAPVEKHAFENPSETLVILPDGPLHLLPFGGLQDARGRFIIEKNPVSYAPSRSVFKHCLFLQKPKVPGGFDAALIDGSSGLPNAKKELYYLSSLYGRNASILAPKDVSIFRQRIAHSQIVHFSGHSVSVQGRPVLLLQNSPSKIYVDCQAINTWNMTEAYLVNLAGCSTAIGPLSEGEAPWGLIPAFLNAGSPAIIASLMPVDDVSTEHLSRRFYDLLHQGSGKAQALRQAQIALLNASRSNSDVKPQSWVPYVLVGNPQ